MGNSLYWSVYKNLEKEVLDLSQWVFIDDGQLATYSVKIADLLMRTAVEIESISKALYFRYGGDKPDDNNLFFDADCLKLLKDKFAIGSKVVFVSDVFQYCSKDENLSLRPLNNSWIKGKCDWKKAYQAIKHDRYNELRKGNIKHLLRALAALFILNLYYSDRSYGLGYDVKATGFDSRMGSDLFSIKVHAEKVNISESSIIEKQPDYDECLYVVQPTGESVERVRNVLSQLNADVISEANRLFTIKMNRFITDGTMQSFRELSLVPDERKRLMHEEAYRKAYSSVYGAYNDRLRDVYQRVEYEAVINKNQH